jgi:hypothetical protein
MARNGRPTALTRPPIAETQHSLDCGHPGPQSAKRDAIPEHLRCRLNDDIGSMKLVARSAGREGRQRIN